MLQVLKIRNYALIDELTFEPGQHFNTITGETGAGKSIILGALGLILGSRADMSALRNPEKKCTVEGVFQLSESLYRDLFVQRDLDWEIPCIIRRELSPSGKSRAFVNDTPVKLDVLREVVSSIIDVHSQNETSEVDRPAFRYDFFKSEKAEEYKHKFNTYKSWTNQLHTLQNNLREWARENEFYRFLYDELEAIGFYNDEAQQLEEDLSALENVEELTENLNFINQVFEDGSNGLLDGLRKVRQALDKLVSLSSKFDAYREQFGSAETEIRELASDLAIAAADIEINPDEIEQKRSRLDDLNRLMDKHKVNSLEELNEIKLDIKSKIDTADSNDEELAELQQKISRLKQELEEIAEILFMERSAKAVELSQKVEEGIRGLGMPNAQFKVEVTQTNELNARGKDQIEFLFSANRGMALQPLSKVASGGERSRMVLVLKSILAEERSLPTMIFDEIDTGVSGEIAGKIGSRLRKMSRTTQLISITHLPQVAACGDRQYKVVKKSIQNSTHTQILELDQNQRIDEIAQMLSGEKVTETAKKAAQELLTID